MPYRLLAEFERLFRGKPYLHRISNQGDFVAIHLFEDLFGLHRSAKLAACVAAGDCVLNTSNRRRGVAARRGDGTFGDRVPNSPYTTEPGYLIPRGPLANVHVGVEVKILQKAMIKQIDRVQGDLLKQVDQFKRGGSSAICVGIVGINCATYTVGYEKDRSYRTDGSGTYRHPAQEAAEAERRLREHVRSAFDEFLILRYRATNDPPFPFEWVDGAATVADYSSALLRISREYDRRF